MITSAVKDTQSSYRDSICPGRYFADNMVWLAIARTLAVFNIAKTKDADGNFIEHEVKFVTGITR